MRHQTLHAVFLVLAGLTLNGLPISAIDLDITPAKTSEVLSDNVTLTCTPGTLKTTGILLMKILKNGQSQPLATVYPNHQAIAYHAAGVAKTKNTQTIIPTSNGGHSNSMQAEGSIDNKVTGHSRLTLTLIDPSYKQSGNYYCEVMYLDVLGGVQTSKVKSELWVKRVDMVTLGHELKELRSLLRTFETDLGGKDIFLNSLHKLFSFLNETHTESYLKLTAMLQNYNARIKKMDENLKDKTKRIDSLAKQLKSTEIQVKKVSQSSLSKLKKKENEFEKRILKQLKSQQSRIKLISKETQSRMNAISTQLNNLQPKIDKHSSLQSGIKSIFGRPG